MTDATIDRIIAIIVNIFSGGFGATVATAYISHKLDKNKIRWEKKGGEYERIISELVEQQNIAWKFTNHDYARKENNPRGKLSEEEINEMRKKRNDGIENIRKTAMNSFIISKEAGKTLEDMLIALDKIDHSDDDAIIKDNDEYKTIKNAVAEFKSYAKKDMP